MFIGQIVLMISTMQSQAGPATSLYPSKVRARAAVCPFAQTTMVKSSYFGSSVFLIGCLAGPASHRWSFAVSQ
jgi:hypothetical protein